VAVANVVVMELYSSLEVILMCKGDAYLVTVSVDEHEYIGSTTFRVLLLLINRRASVDCPLQREVSG
jgi:hypothetical protein